MGTYATQSDVDSLRTAYAGFVSAISHTDGTTESLLQKQAQLALDKWADCQLAIINVNASAASSYSTGVGSSFTKKRLDDLESAATTHMEEFIRVCALGGQTVPTVDDAVAFWDLSGISNE